MQNIYEQLEKLGLKSEEALIYVKLLKDGPASLSELSRKLQINRTTLYPYIENLLSMFLIKKTEKGKKVIYTARNPKILKKLIDEKQKTLSKIFEDLENLYKNNYVYPNANVSQIEEKDLTPADYAQIISGKSAIDKLNLKESNALIIISGNPAGITANHRIKFIKNKNFPDKLALIIEKDKSSIINFQNKKVIHINDKESSELFYSLFELIGFFVD